MHKKPWKFGKIIFYSIISVSLSILILYVLIVNIVLSNNVISNLEYNDMKSRIHQSQSILNTRISELQKVAKDYGIWQESYYKVQEKDTEWFKENFSDWMPGNFGLDLILVVSKDKEILDQYGISKSTSDLIENGTIEKVLNNNYANEQYFPYGFKIYDGKLYILGISPILKGNGDANVNGVVIIGKKVTQEFVAEINQQFDIRMLIAYNNNVISVEKDHLTVEEYLNDINNSDKDVISLGETVITANTKIYDISSKEIGKLIVLESPRTFLNATRVIRNYSFLVLLLCIVIVLILSLRIKDFIEKPIKNLTNQIYQMTEEDRIVLVDANGPYEVIKLANAFNNLLVKLRMQQEENIILQNTSKTDSLTTLYNKRYFMESIEKMASQKEHEYSLMFCDIDYFKKINDQYGHQIGDVVLKEIGGIIKKTVDGKGQAFRYGGEEFAIIIENVKASLEISEEIRVSVSSSRKLKEVCPNLIITISIGIASYPKDGNDGDSLIRKADIAMYYCKKNGRNQCKFYDSNMEMNTL